MGEPLTIRVNEPPRSGTFTIRPDKLTTSVFYQARVGATGTDHLVYEVVNASNKVDAYDVTITIREAPKGSTPNSDKPI
jgi:hypothetical protein